MASNKSHHFVLVHGLGQGAWCWYKLKTLLQSAGHKVSAPDLLASGTNLKHIDEVGSMLEYSEPLLELMESIPSEEKVVIVGHSLGGMSIAYAIEKFPHKIAVGVFLTAFMPDTVNPPSYVLDKYLEFVPEGMFMDSELSVVDTGNGKSKTNLSFGPEFQTSKLYQLSAPECLVYLSWKRNYTDHFLRSKDSTLGITLTRVGSLFNEELLTAPKFSNERYGSVERVYIVAKQDLGLPTAFQRWMIENNPVKEVREIEGIDHFAMISKPKEVCQTLIEIADEYA